MAYYLVVSNDQKPVLLYNPNANGPPTLMSGSEPLSLDSVPILTSKEKVLPTLIPKGGLILSDLDGKSGDQDSDEAISSVPAKKSKSEVVKKEPVLARPEFVDTLKAMLPTSFAYKIMSMDGASRDSFEASMRVELRTEEDAMRWLQEFQKISKSDWRVNRTYPPEGGRLLYKKRFHCHRNTKATKVTNAPRAKHTNCKARVTITIKNYFMKRSKDGDLKDLPGIITIMHIHNHPIDDALLVRRRVDPGVKEKLRKMFEVGHSQTSAHKTLKFDLEIEHGENYPKIAADNSKCPALRDSASVYKAHYEKYLGKEKTKHYGGKGLWMLDSLPAIIDKYNEDCGEKCANMHRWANDIAISICTPLMKRVHRHLPSSGEHCLVWSSGRMYRYNLKVYIQLASSDAGPLPLGIFIVTSDSDLALTKALEQYHSLLGEWAFFKQGTRGPPIVITNDAPNEKSTLQATYSRATHYLNVEHVLQEFWRYVIDEKHGTTRVSDRIEMFRVFKSLVEWPHESTFNAQLRIAQDYSILVKYLSVLNHLKHDLIPKVDQWAVCKRPKTLMATSNFNDVMVKVLGRSMTFGLVPLFDFLVNHLEGYFREKLSARLNDRLDNYTLSSYEIAENKQLTLTCEKLSDDIYRVIDKQSGLLNEVNTCARICSCQIGLTGAECRHQSAVISQFNLLSLEAIPRCNELSKVILHLIVNDTGDVSTECFKAAAITDELTEQLPVFDDDIAEESMMFKREEQEKELERFGETVTGESSMIELVTEEPAVFGTITGNTQVFERAITGDSTVIEVAVTDASAVFEDVVTEGSASSGSAEQRIVFSRDASMEEDPGDEDLKKRVQNCEDRLGLFCDSLLKKLKSNPVLFLPTVEKFLDGFIDASKTDESMKYALSFSQFTGIVEVEMQQFFKGEN